MEWSCTSRDHALDSAEDYPAMYAKLSELRESSRSREQHFAELTDSFAKRVVEHHEESAASAKKITEQSEEMRQLKKSASEALETDRVAHERQVKELETELHLHQNATATATGSILEMKDQLRNQHATLGAAVARADAAERAIRQAEARAKAAEDAQNAMQDRHTEVLQMQLLDSNALLSKPKRQADNGEVQCKKLRKDSSSSSTPETTGDLKTSK